MEYNEEKPDLTKIRAMQSLNRFISRQGNKGKKIIISQTDKERLIQRRHKKGFQRFLGDFGNALAKFKTETGVNRFLVIIGERDPTSGEFIPGRWGESDSIRMNFAKVKPGTEKFEKFSNELIERIKRDKGVLKPIEIKAPKEILPLKEELFEENGAKKIPVVKTSKTVSEEKGETLLELGPNIKIRRPDIKGLETRRGVSETGFYSLSLARPGGSLNIWLDIDRVKEITIGNKDYRLREDKLIDLTPVGFFGGYREFPLEKRGEEIIIDLRKIEWNDKLNEFLKT